MVAGTAMNVTRSTGVTPNNSVATSRVNAMAPATPNATPISVRVRPFLETSFQHVRSARAQRHANAIFAVRRATE